ncbi:MAG: SEC-C domain-containing protein [Deltaproteobacteria bacterium]|nr:SEC-C domain-containing protein [Deltaproteobacteria bacterium]
MTPGRNDPCPCGSGKKFKLCCMRARDAALETPSALAWRRLRRALDDFAMGKTLFEFILTTYGGGAPDEAWAEFSGVEEPFDPQTPHVALFMSWLFHCWSPDPHDPSSTVDEALHERIPTQLFLERAGKRLDPLVRSYLEGCLEAPFSFHEVLRCDLGRGFNSRDLFTGEERDVLERSATQGMEPGDIVFGQLIDAEGITMLECAGSCFIPPIRKIELIDFRKKLLRGRANCTREALRDWDFELIERYLKVADDVLHPRMPEIRNTDGEPVEMHHLVFDIDSPEVVVRALADLDFEATAEQLVARAERTSRGEIKRVTWDWKKTGNRMHKSWSNTILGHLEIKGRKLTAEVNSARRAIELRLLIESRFGDEVRFRADRTQALEKLMGERVSSGRADGTDWDSVGLEGPDATAAVQQLMAEHYESWVSEKIPLLDGRTPLEAVRDPEGREKVLALLIDAERHARRMKPPVDEAVLRRLRERLGLAGT